MSKKKLRTKLLLWFGSVIGILLLVIASFAIYIGTRSDEWWSDIISNQLSKTLGREVEIQGKFHLDIGRIITIEVSSIRVSNPDWSESPDMLRVGSLLLVFDPLSFFGDALLIQRLELADIDLALEETQDGKNNWTFAVEPEPSSETTSTSKPDKGIALPVGIEQLSLQHARISLKQPSRKQLTVLQVDNITGATSPDGKAVLDGSGQLNDQPMSLNVLLEPSDTGFHLRPSKLVVGGYKVTAEGHIATKEQFRAELNVTGKGPDLSVITRLANTIQLPAWPFQAKGKIDITAKDITLIGVSGTTGKNNVAVNGPIAFSASGPLKLDVKGSGPSLQAVLKGLGYDVIPASAPYEAEAKVEITNNQLVVIAKQARLGPTEAVATLNIPDLNTPTSLMVDVREVKTPNISATLALVGVKLKLPKVMPANFIGQIERSKHATKLS
ncbi:MAG: AsmA family protein, partial [Thiohalomonadales bacterium]|nr:AsmA family protein [Thiohalomonadales bacterium]